MKQSVDLTFVARPSPTFDEQISIDDGRRSELSGILRNNDSREDVSLFRFHDNEQQLNILASGSMDGFDRREKRNGNFDYRTYLAYPVAEGSNDLCVLGKAKDASLGYLRLLRIIECRRPEKCTQ